MSEEQKREGAAETDHDKSVDTVDSGGSNGSGDSTERSGMGKFTRSIETANPVVLLLFMILLMVVVLAMISLRGSRSKDAGASSDDPVLAALKADVEARRSELNRQRMAMGLPPLEGGSEPIEDIATRLKDDTDTLVGLAGSFQQMLSDKDAEISQRNNELLRLEKLRQDISLENSKLQAEMNRALLSASEASQLRKLADDMQAQRDELSRQLTDVRAQLAEAEGAVNAEDYTDLQRRYDEALRSKSFFENRVKELESEDTGLELAEPEPESKGQLPE
jgi:chromosome segregation ATPase